MDLEAIYKLTAPVVREAGHFIKKELGRVRQGDVEEKALNSLVSYVDKQAEEILVEGLGNILPAAGFLTEEDTVNNQESGLRWIIDPLDGTTNFLYNLPIFAVSVALVDENDQILLGMVLDVIPDELYYAWLGGGAYRDGEQIYCSEVDETAKSLIATGFHYNDFTRIDAHLAAVKYFIEHSRGIRRLGSAALDLVYTACGRFEAFYEYSLNPWDVAGGALIVQEAGGHVADFSGGKNYLFGGEIMAAGGRFYPVFQTRMSHFFST